MTGVTRLTPFDGEGTWLARGSREGAAPLVRWVQRHGLALPDDHVEVLLRCESAAEARFILPIITLSDWAAVIENGFTNGRLTITLQEQIGPYRADFVFRGPGFGRPLVIEIDGPTHDGAVAERRDSARTEALSSSGFDVRRVKADMASEAGNALRRELSKESLQRALAGSSSTPVVLRKRAWSSNPLAYEVDGLRSGERRELLSSWLNSREISIPPRMEELLATCDEAAEVNFVLPFVRLDGAYTDGSEFLGIDPYWLLLGQGDKAGRMDVVLGRDCGETIEVVVFDIEPPPFVSFDSWEAEQKRRGWRRRGFNCVRVGAVRAASEGKWWADRLAASLRGGYQVSLTAWLS